MVLSEIKNSLWVEKYRPQKIEDIILPDRIKNIFINLLSKKEIPNLLLTGSAGSGKTTLAKVFVNELGANNLFINASKERGIDVLRNQIENFVSTVSIDAGVNEKIVILDEIDNMSNTAIMALRGFIEEFSINARFFLTCNYVNKIADPIRSRMQAIEFNWTTEERKQLMKDCFNRITFILKNENIKLEDAGRKALAEMIKKLFPDIRKLIGNIQIFSRIDGSINEGILYMLDDRKFDDLYRYMKEKNFPKTREWVANNITGSVDTFYDQLYKDLDKVFEPKSIPEVIMYLEKYMYEGSFVFLKEVNIMACILMIMANCEMK